MLCFFVPEARSGDFVISPGQDETTFGSTRSAAKNIIKRIEFGAPFGAAKCLDLEVREEFRKRCEFLTVDDDDGL